MSEKEKNRVFFDMRKKKVESEFVKNGKKEGVFSSN